MTLLDNFLKEMDAKNRTENTMKTLIFALKDAEQKIEKELEDAEWSDILRYIEGERKRNNINCQSKDPNAPQVERKLSDATISNRLARLKQFYGYCFDETDNPKYRKIIKKLRDFVKPGRKDINPQELLTPEDVKRLINVATLERDKCLIASMFESGMRIGELLALSRSMIDMKEDTQEVVFHIPDKEGCKTGARSVTCLEIYGYVQDWLKCNPDDMLFDLTIHAVHKINKKLFSKAGIDKPHNPHMFRHSAITHTVALGMSETQICYRFWGIPHSAMLSTYIHLNEQMQADGYKTAKGMNGEAVKVINPLAVRCVNCGRLIQSGNLCKPCSDSKKLAEDNKKLAEALKRQEEALKQQDTQIKLLQMNFKPKYDLSTAKI